MTLVAALDGNTPIVLPDCPTFGCRVPFDGEYLVTQSFRNPSWSNGGIFYHRGIDLIRRDGTIAGAPLLAAADGQVRAVNDLHWSYGNHVQVYHGLHVDEAGTVWAVSTLVAHLSSANVTVGQIVKQGDVLGWADNTGLSTGSHLHWEVRYDELRVAPLDFVRAIPPPPPPPSELEEWIMTLPQATQDALMRVAQHEQDIVYLGDKGLLLAMYDAYGAADTEGRKQIKRRVGRLFESFGEPLVGEPTNVLQRLNKTLSLPNAGTPAGSEGIPVPEDDGSDE